MLHVLNDSSADILWPLNHSSRHRASFFVQRIRSQYQDLQCVIISQRCTFPRLLSMVAFWGLFCGRDLEVHRGYQFLVIQDGGKSAMSPWVDSFVYWQDFFWGGKCTLVFPKFVARSVGTYTTRELTLDSEVPHSLTLRSLGSRRS